MLQGSREEPEGASFVDNNGPDDSSGMH